ncbi:hypothetical protein OROMI_016720 [Orobanche minor]
MQANDGSYEGEKLEQLQFFTRIIVRGKCDITSPDYLNICEVELSRRRTLREYIHLLNVVQQSNVKGIINLFTRVGIIDATMDPHNSHVDNDFAKEHLGKLFLDHKKKDIDVSMIESKKVDRLFDNRKVVEKEICPREACLEERELVQKIASAAEFSELMDFFHKISTRTIDLMWEALKVDIENENKVWESLRLWIVEMLETEAKIEEFNLTKEYLAIFPENHHIWANLKKLTVMLGDSVMLDELKFACDIIKLDPRHTYAWSLRCSMVMNIQNDGENRRELEFNFLNHLLSADPLNECAWLYRGDLISMRCSDITRKLKSQNTNGLTVDCISDILNKELIFIETALLKFLDNNFACSDRMWVNDVFTQY